jgi:hypothetical protein
VVEAQALVLQVLVAVQLQERLDRRTLVVVGLETL